LARRRHHFKIIHVVCLAILLGLGTTKFDVSITGLSASDGTVYVNAFSNNNQKRLDNLKKKYIG
jgi:hypothetical protein